MLSISDYPMALLADRAGLDTILVGDSLAMTVLGYETTVSVTLEEMLHHSKAVTRATKYAHVVGDMPFMSNNTSERDAIINAGRFMQEAGTDSVKVEGGVDAAQRRQGDRESGNAGHGPRWPNASAHLPAWRIQGPGPGRADRTASHRRRAGGRGGRGRSPSSSSVCRTRSRRS